MTAFAHCRGNSFPSDGSDLEIFVSRPDLRPPKLSTNVYEPQLASPGFWFVAPYSDLQERLPTSIYQPLQTGPHIYDTAGNLVWSGSHLAAVDRPMHDFKVSIINSTIHLSLIVMTDSLAEYRPGGVALILNSNYEIVREINPLRGSGYLDMHEFRIIDNGKSALMIVHQQTNRQIFRPGTSSSLRSILNSGFVEIDLESEKVVFEWWALDHVDPTESLEHVPNRLDATWDWLHPNSVDKNDQGDFLLSARYTDTIYKISGNDGTILWRLGGKNSTFAFEDFNFSGQHDARFHNLGSDTAVDNEQFLTLLNNAAADGRQSSSHSQGMVIALDSVNQTARLHQAFSRPDNELSRLRGNFQLLTNSNAIASWSDNAYISEHSASGQLISEASFTSERFVTYRAYKFEFVGHPNTRPDLKVISQQFNGTTTTAMYVSWNGATEVTAWRFFARDRNKVDMVAMIPRQGFETSYMMLGLPSGGCYVEALDSNGEVLGVSQTETSIMSIWSTAEHEDIADTAPSFASLGLLSEVQTRTDLLRPIAIFSRFDICVLGVGLCFIVIRVLKKLCRHSFVDRSRGVKDFEELDKEL